MSSDKRRRRSRRRETGENIDQANVFNSSAARRSAAAPTAVFSCELLSYAINPGLCADLHPMMQLVQWRRALAVLEGPENNLNTRRRFSVRDHTVPPPQRAAFPPIYLD